MEGSGVVNIFVDGADGTKGQNGGDGGKGGKGASVSEIIYPLYGQVVRLKRHYALLGNKVIMFFDLQMFCRYPQV